MICLAVVVWLVGLTPAIAEWSQYRGPDQTGVAACETSLATWVDSRPSELWRRPIGAGFSAVVTDGERLYTMAVRDEIEHLVALDPATGATVWRTSTDDPSIASEFGHGPRSTPTVVDGVVYAATSAANLLAVRADSGAVVWRRELGRPAPRFGYASSPRVVSRVGPDGESERVVVVEAGSSTAGESVWALDAASGDVRWKALDGPANYSSPVLATLGGVPQLLFSRRTPELVSLSLDGEVLWRYETGAKTAIPLPLALPPDRVFVASSDDDFGGAMLRVTALEDGGWSVDSVWSNRLMRNHFNTSVVVGDQLYGFDNATFKCLDAATGERRWAKRGFGKAALIAVGDTLVVQSDDGLLTLVRADPTAYRELGSVRATRGKAWTEPMLAHGRLVARDHDEIVAFAVAASPVATASSAASDRPTAPSEPEAGWTLAQILERHAAARGGRDAWTAVSALEARGTYAAFSESSSFVLTRARGAGFHDLYRLDFQLMDAPAVRARDATGAWHQHALLQAEPARLEAGPYQDLVERESLFAPPLFSASTSGEASTDGLRVALKGRGEVAGKPTIELEVRFPDDDVELWSLDAETFLEVRVEGEVNDFTQGLAPMRSRWFFSDFRAVGELVLPYRLEWEYGARLEIMDVDTWVVAPEIPDDRFSPPTPEPSADAEDGASGP